MFYLSAPTRWLSGGRPLYPCPHPVTTDDMVILVALNSAISSALFGYLVTQVLAHHNCTRHMLR